MHRQWNDGASNVSYMERLGDERPLLPGLTDIQPCLWVTDKVIF